jgi:integral membrane protein (TIGR00529 family)
MIDLFRLILTLILILILLRKKWNVGYVLMIASTALFLLYLMNVEQISTAVKHALSDQITVKLLIALTFIRIFEFILREREILENMMSAMKGVFRNKKAVILSMPLLIGMLPSVGGAYFSAPMVDTATQDIAMTPEEKTFANYWYRHPWEFILPLYPGLILASALTSIEVRTFILLNFPYAISMFVAGLWGLRKAKGSFKEMEKMSRGDLWNFLPIALLLLFVIVGGIELHYALVVLVFLMLLFFRYSAEKTKEAFKGGFSTDVIVLILGVMLFKETLEVSGAVDNISRFFAEKNIPLIPVLFLLPFITGLLTGITVGFVGSSFPLLANLVGTDPYAFTFAFASGFIGVLLSPVHVCLILTREYFRADMIGVYKKIIPSVCFILILALSEFFILRQ